MGRIDDGPISNIEENQKMVGSGHEISSGISANIEGSYKISIEQSARKQVEGLLATTKRLLGHVGIADISDPPGKEEQIQRTIAAFKEEQENISGFSLDLQTDRIVGRGSGEETIYLIKDRIVKGTNQVLLILDNDEMGRVQWDVSLVNDHFFVFESEDDMSEFVWERV